LAELSVEEARRLARNFLTGRGEEAESEQLRQAVETDTAAALELLQQMQSALDDVAPAGFTPEQWKDIDLRVSRLIQPLAKGGLGFIGRFFSRLFRKKSAAPAASGGRIKRKGSPEPATAPLGEAPTSLAAETQAETGMEEMAPIAPSGTPAAPEPAAAAEEPEPASGDSSKREAALGRLAPLLAAILLAGIAFYGVYRAWPLLKGKLKQRNQVQVAAAPAPTPVPSPRAVPERRQPPTEQKEPLPSELPPMTPQPAGQTLHLEGLGASPEGGGRGLPLP
jgi:hypothetical protein